MRNSRSFRNWRFASVTILIGVMVFQSARADNGKPQAGTGKYSELTATWWAWIFAQPTVDVGSTNTNPVLDSTGQFASSGQKRGIGPANKYFFLAGAFGGDVTRTATVPAGKTLLFPIYNFQVDNAFDPPTSNTVPQLRAIAKANIDAVNIADLYALLDGEPVAFFRTTSPTFSYTLPAENSLYDYFGLSGPQFEGTVHPVVSDGYWAVIAPLPPGEYVLEFGSVPYLNVTYYLTVE